METQKEEYHLKMKVDSSEIKDLKKDLKDIRKYLKEVNFLLEKLTSSQVKGSIKREETRND